jgi:hypothetical protein
MIGLLKQSSTAQPLVFLMLDSADHISPKTGLTCTVTLSKAGAAFASPAGAVTEIGSGWYKVAGNATDTNTLGPLLLHATATGADPSDIGYNVVAFDPQSANSMITGVNGIAPPPNWNLMVIDGSGRLDLSKWAGSAVNALISGKVDANAQVVGDKTGYALTTGEHTAIATDTQTGLTAQGYTTTRAGYLDTLNGLVANIWTNATRTLSTVADSAGVTTLLSRLGAALTITGGKVDVNDKTGFALTSGEHTNVAADVQTGLTSQGYSVTRAGYLDFLNSLAATVWNALTSGMTTAGSIGKRIADNLDVAVSSVSGGGGGGVVTGYASGQDPATLLLTNPSHLLATDGSGNVSLSPSDSTVLTLLGLLGSNQVVRDLSYDGDGILLGATVRLYNNATNATNDDGATGLLHAYTIANVVTGGNVTTQTQVLAS